MILINRKKTAMLFLCAHSVHLHHNKYYIASDDSCDFCFCRILYCMDMSNLTLFPLLVAFVLISDVVVPFIAPKVWSFVRNDSVKLCLRTIEY